MNPRPLPWALASVLLLGSGCVYYNGLYNARRLYDEGERARLAGSDSVARRAYREAGEKADRSYRAEPDGKWADDALYLMGRAQLRQGDMVRARASLEEAARRTDDESIRRGASLYLAVVAMAGDDRERATALLNDVLRRVEDDELRAEAHLWRARLLLESGQLDAGWWDLDRAAEVDARHRVAAAVERLTWGVVHADGGRASAGAQTLLASPGAHVRVDTLEALVRRVEKDWGAAPAADLLQGAEEAGWPPSTRDRLVLLRSRLRARHGDVATARRDAAWVAGGAGPGAVDARLLLADLEAARAASVEELELVRPLLLPVVEQPRVLARLEAIRTVQLLAHRGREEPSRRVALFAAAGLTVLAALFAVVVAEGPLRPVERVFLYVGVGLLTLGVTMGSRLSRRPRARLMDGRFEGDPDLDAVVDDERPPGLPAEEVR
ncbi:MAG: hypothetical protein KY453_12305 [Gemmatimonadetes bacterium]|nr:hypothetical protein [Gemmatimonadota bacterium]